MLDRSKRKVLLSLGGVMATSFLPRTAFSANELKVSNLSATGASIAPHLIAGQDTDLTILLMLDGSPKMKVTNTATTLKILRRVQPGVVRVGEKSFDLNQSLISSAYAIGAGATRFIPIAEITDTTSEAILAARYKRKPLSVASIEFDGAHGQTMEVSRVFVA